MALIVWAMFFLDVLAKLFYRLIVDPIHCYFSLTSFITCFTFLASPSIILQHAAVTTLPRLFKSQRPRRSSNLRIRRLLVLLGCCCRKSSRCARRPSFTTTPSSRFVNQPHTPSCPFSSPKSTRINRNRLDEIPEPEDMFEDEDSPIPVVSDDDETPDADDDEGNLLLLLEEI